MERKTLKMLKCLIKRLITALQGETFARIKRESFFLREFLPVKVSPRKVMLILIFTGKLGMCQKNMRKIDKLKGQKLLYDSAPK